MIRARPPFWRSNPLHFACPRCYIRCTPLEPFAWCLHGLLRHSARPAAPGVCEPVPRSRAWHLGQRPCGRPDGVPCQRAPRAPCGEQRTFAPRCALRLSRRPTTAPGWTGSAHPGHRSRPRRAGDRPCTEVLTPNTRRCANSSSTTARECSIPNEGVFDTVRGWRRCDEFEM